MKRDATSPDVLNQSKTVAIILSGGAGNRFGADIPKQFISLNGNPIIFHTVTRIMNHPQIDDVIIVSHKNWISRTKKLFPNLRVIPGGRTRQESSKIGIMACPSDTKYVLIHDAVRPLIFNDLIDRCIESLRNGAVAVATVIPSSDTIAAVNDDEIANIPDRALLRRSQTPQAFVYDVIREAHERATTLNSTDDVRLVFDLGYPCKTVEGDPLNLKVTTIADLYTIERLIQFEKPKVIESFDFSNKTAVVFGGTSGIGANVAKILERAGAHVIRCGRKECDVRDIEAVDGLLRSLDSVDIIVNSAGILIPHFIADVDPSVITDIINTNLIGAINITKVAARYMCAGGHIVHVGSSSAYYGRHGYSVYSASKAGLANFCQAAASEFKEYGIRVNVVSPPRTNTRLYRNLFPDVDSSTLYKPEDAAKVICSYCIGEETGCIVDLKLHMHQFGNDSSF